MSRDMNLALIQSGRTTRMIELAVKLAFQGRAVYILVQQKQHEKYLTHRVQETWDKACPGRGGHGIKVEAYAPYWEHHLDWSTLRARGMHPNCEILLDHTLVEWKIGQLQDEIKWRAELIGKLYPKTV